VIFTENQLFLYNFVQGGEEEEVGIDYEHEVLQFRKPVDGVRHAEVQHHACGEDHKN
jgi:hypothetical protein